MCKFYREFHLIFKWNSHIYVKNEWIIYLKNSEKYDNRMLSKVESKEANIKVKISMIWITFELRSSHLKAEFNVYTHKREAMLITSPDKHSETKKWSGYTQKKSPPIIFCTLVGCSLIYIYFM